MSVISRKALIILKAHIVSTDGVIFELSSSVPKTCLQKAESLNILTQYLLCKQQKNCIKEVDINNHTPNDIVSRNSTASHAKTNHVVMPATEKKAAHPEYCADISFDRLLIIHDSFQTDTRSKPQLKIRLRSSAKLPQNISLNFLHDSEWSYNYSWQTSDLGLNQKTEYVAQSVGPLKSTCSTQTEMLSKSLSFRSIKAIKKIVKQMRSRHRPWTTALATSHRYDILRRWRCSSSISKFSSKSLLFLRWTMKTYPSLLVILVLLEIGFES